MVTIGGVQGGQLLNTHALEISGSLAPQCINDNTTLRGWLPRNGKRLLQQHLWHNIKPTVSLKSILGKFTVGLLVQTRRK
jgi:hypothetical protein